MSGRIGKQLSLISAASAAVKLGWRVLRYNSRQLGSRQGVYDAVEEVCEIISGADCQHARNYDTGEDGL